MVQNNCLKCGRNLINNNKKCLKCGFISTYVIERENDNLFLKGEIVEKALEKSFFSKIEKLLNDKELDIAKEYIKKAYKSNPYDEGIVLYNFLLEELLEKKRNKMLENDNLSDYIKEEIYSIKDIDLSKKAEQFNLSIIDVENKIIEYVKELISENTFKSINLANELLTKVKNLDISELQKKLSLKLKNNEEIRNNAIFTAVTELQSFPEYDINIEAINILKSEFKKVWEKRMLTDINNIESLNALDQKIKDIQIKIEELNKGYQPYERSVCFGVFENELIEWKCLRISGDKALLIAQKPIVSKKYDERLNDWKYSSIREWLNNEFINGSFNNNEIEKMNVSPLGDRINLLSIEDALEYFKDPNDRNVGQWYWLSNKGYRKNRIAMVNEHGEINFFGDKIDCLDGIRPVICIDLK